MAFEFVQQWKFIYCGTVCVVISLGYSHQLVSYCLRVMAEDQALDVASIISAHCIIQWSPRKDQQLPKGNHTTTTVIS